MKKDLWVHSSCNPSDLEATKAYGIYYAILFFLLFGTLRGFFSIFWVWILFKSSEAGSSVWVLGDEFAEGLGQDGLGELSTWAMAF